MENRSPFRVKGAFDFGIALICGRIVQAAAFFVMARILDASQMGTVAILTVLLIGFFQMTNLGFDRYIVYARNQDDISQRQTINAVWTLQLMRGLIVVAAVAPISLYLDRYTDIDLGVLYVLGIASVVALLSFVHPGLSTFERNGNFTYVARSRAISIAAGGGTVIILVLIWSNPWVYIAGQLVQALSLVCFSCYYSPERPRLSLEARHLRMVLKFGKHIVILAAVSFLSVQAQNFYIGVLFGPAILGFFFTWSRMIDIPREFVTQVLDRILFAAASAKARQTASPASMYLIGFSLTMATMVPFNLFVWFHGDQLMLLTAGEKWMSFWWVGRILVLVSFFYSIAGTVSPFMLVTHPHFTSVLRSIEAFLIIGLLLILGPKFGISGVLAAILIVIILAVFARLFVLFRFILIKNQIRCISQMFAILGIVTIPLLAWEGFSHASLPATVQFEATFLFYLCSFVLLSLIVFWNKTSLLKVLK